MRMTNFADESDVDEALRLFKASTLEAAGSGSLAGQHLMSSSSSSEFYMILLS